MKNSNSETVPILTTERLTLRPLSDKDGDEIFLLRSDPLINKYLDRQHAVTIDDAFGFIEMIKNNIFSYWAISRKGNDKLIGIICLFDISEELKKCEIGYELLNAYQGKGFMREAAIKLMEYSIRTLGISTIDAHTHKDNQSSTNLLQKLGFKNVDNLNETNSDFILFQLDMSGNNEA